MGEERQQLVGIVQSQMVARGPCELAEVAILGALLEERLQVVGVRACPDVAVAVMAVAMLLASEAPEFGGDARDALGAVAALGLDLLERSSAGD